MGILSSLLKSAPAAPTVSGQPIQVSEIPAELKPYYKDILGKAQALYDKRVKEGFQAYQGPTLAKVTPEQEQAYTGIAGLQGMSAPKFQEAEQLTREGAADITGQQIQEAMSPYQQAVTDIQKRESQQQFEQNVLPKLRASQIAQGSFGGTRGTLLEAQALGDQQRLLSDIQAKGSQAAFADARRALEAQRIRSGQAGSQLSNIAPLATKTISGEIGLQQAVGEDKQRYAQTALDEAYRQFQAEQQEPYDAMQKYQAVVTGAPIAGTQYAAAQPQPSLAQTLIGGLGTAVGAYGAFGGLDRKGKTGGGISTLPIINRKVSGKVDADSLMKYNDAAFIEPFKIPPKPGGRQGIAWDNKYGRKGFKAGDVVGKYRVTGSGKEDIRPLKYLKTNVQKITSDPETVSTPEAFDSLSKYASSIQEGDTSVSALEGLLATQQSGLGDLKKILKEKGTAAKGIDTALGQLPTTKQADEATEKFYADKAQRAKEAQTIDERDTRREQFANMAKFFARLGTASPQTGGIQGLVGAGLKAAEETAPDVIATQTAAKTRADARREKSEERADKKRLEKLSNKTKDLEKLQAKYNLLEKKGASAKALADAETNILQAMAEIETLKASTQVNIGDLMPKDLTKTEDRLKALTTGRIVGDVPTFEAAQNAALLQAQTEVESTLNDIQNRGGLGALKRVSSAQVEAAILGRAQQILTAGGQLSRVTGKRQSNIQETDSDASASTTLDKLINENEEEK
jgi:hypothetical protein